jgi:hypothetical protein
MRADHWIVMVAATGLAALAACAGAPTPLPEADGADAKLYAARCGTCHSVPHPARHTALEWERVLRLMDQRTAEAGMAPLAGEERERVVAYLTRHGR